MRRRLKLGFGLIAVGYAFALSATLIGEIQQGLLALVELTLVGGVLIRYRIVPIHAYPHNERRE
jgi:hypothetical protein